MYHILDPIGYEFCLVFLIESLEENDLLTYGIRCKKRLLHLIGVVFYHTIRSIDDRLSRAIVLIEDDDLCFGVVLLK